MLISDSAHSFAKYKGQKVVSLIFMFSYAVNLTTAEGGAIT